MDFRSDGVGAGFTEAQFLTFLSTRQLFYDDFVGSALQTDIWTLSGDAGFSYTIGNSIVALFPNAAANDIVRINWNGKTVYNSSKQNPITMIMRVAFDNALSKRWRLGLYNSATNYIAFELNTSVDNNFRAVTNKAGTPTSVDTGITFAAHTAYLLKIVVTSTTDVKFYIDDDGTGFVLVASITTNVPTVVLEALIEAETLTAAAYGIFLDKVIITANPYSISPP